ncbi:bifunctional DNA-formamidopyrimidine glycosylase/DNA-(apurinic or apyrimidinic site) lyase [Desulfonatronospira sp.]|uniref:bifunctional DNA-formamidopyrimidine glycosylase/DNA-(apurinic or apyrimidinic site) lyase n=1 Tax=Desulfonatronospira sp. TaxID=1962951 RepID=UPI0025C16B41|nr:bifunctional DNA-formamidopyrimidine glycosylase/DNA-(apurinic or apyrimidinic site) lyase [Desulfonatronospira sp.]
MPELPEVETIAAGLSPLVCGRTIRDIHLVYPRAVRGDDQEFQRRLQGRGISAVRRRAKLLILDLDGPLHLVFHLKMTGKVWVPQKGVQPGKHTHLILDLGDEVYVFFDDQRRFGYVTALTPLELESWDFYRNLGPEPLQATLQEFTGIIQGRKARIKSLLMDQKVIAGIGNIYADEALYMAGIHPCTRAVDLSVDQLSSLHHNLQQVLREAILAGGSSFRDYRNALGVAGLFQENFKVYGKKGLPCPECSTNLGSIRVSGRSSCFCPRCQAEKSKS